MDENPPRLGNLIIDGRLTFKNNRNRRLTVNNIWVRQG
jgi:hypothetical protein